MEKPWVSGPKELLQHGLRHLMMESDFDTRIALISIDNAVELAIKTYLSLPKRVTRINISRTEYDQISESFPKLLDAIEQHASDKLVGIDLSDLEWYHRIRNKIYHEGSGITVERQKVDNYAQIARILFENLFGTHVELPEEIMRPTVTAEFIDKWVELEKTLYNIALRSEPVPYMECQPELLFPLWHDLGLVSNDFVKDFQAVRAFRNNLVHGLATPSTEQVKDHLRKLTHLLKEVKEG